MLGGLSRWLRAAGYEASFDGQIDDRALVRRASDEKRILLSSDGGVFERSALRRGEVRGLFVPRATPPVEQLAFVLRALELTILDPRCMACGGALHEIDKHETEGRVPPRSFAAFDRFWTCRACNKLFWHGTHWMRIRRALDSSIANGVVPDVDAP
jgi:uncharacterized protein with PIN domain